MVKDYYGILGVGRQASENEIKSAYRKLSKKYHPDMHVNDTEEEKKKAEEKFKEIAEAYSVLSDKDKKARYDRGEDSGADFDINEFFRNHMHHFDGFNPFGGGFNFDFGGPQQTQNIGEDVAINVKLSFSEAYAGCEKEVSYSRGESCSHCHGTGSADGRQTTCPHCNGSGIIQERRSQGPNFVSIVSKPCPYCHGTGKAVSNPCKECNGTGVKKTFVKRKIRIPAGIFNGAQMSIEQEGSYPAGGGIPGNLVINFTVAEDNYFVRPDAVNVIHYEDVSVADALLGFEKEFRFPDGSKKKIKIPECTKDGQSFIEKKAGFPDARYGNGNKGDYAIVIRYKYPSKLTKKQRDLLNDFKK